MYDILGKEIATLVDKELSAGTYETEVDGSRLSSGIYVYSLKVDGKFSAVKKMILMK
ncbi:MAG TPA: hypothetical protein VLM39_01970 [Ignavibacteriaceae bacterium]|nr:hypothetical protein [Ignavibacteriaceae bacterium]